MKLINVEDIDIYDLSYEPGEYIKQYLDNLKPVEAKPVVHAYWKENMFCSNCGGFREDERGYILQSHSDYCPDCGAIMDKEVK